MISRIKSTLMMGLAVFMTLFWVGAGFTQEKDEMVLIPFGEFVMGSPDHYDEKEHRVVLSPYYIDQYEVSNKRFGAFIKATGHPAPAYWDDNRYNKPDHPVVGVNWYDAKAFCEWESKRLPTEAEWEKAAKGPQESFFPWGNDFQIEKVNCCQKVGTTSPVDSFPEGASGYGVFNMAGNAYEWVADWYDHQYYGISPALNPKGPERGFDWGALGEMKVIRGGSWFAPRTSQHASHRFWNQPENNSYGIGLGFRCAKSASEKNLERARMAFMKALIGMGGEKNDTALSSIEQAISLDPNNPEYRELKKEITERLKAMKR